MRTKSASTRRRKADDLRTPKKTGKKAAAPSQAPQGGNASASDATAWDDLVAVKLIRIAEIISRGATQVYEAGYGVRNTELRILLHLGGGKRLSINEISRRTRVDKAWISRSLAAMKRDNLIKRVPHETDSRKSLILLSEEGEKLLQTIKPIALTRNRHLLAGLKEQEVHQMLDLLRERAEQLLLPEMEEKPAKRSSKRRKSVMVPTY